ncbi:hypothetical protein HL653_11805 [Sphingomonas sp. AP4-R1]|uniref:2-keto-4-pentenoate hydratase n=1 Tax=Sphingomonas sp. AP4-R1 TaxID=2735134 RepID=UPI001493C703|nr:hypothetical protein [Sphingomonas sp. AP4-R1]QJU58366.1 hypothetical protein HL653_11805 [Sphingomonas sp. AP4-R1]
MIATTALRIAAACGAAMLAGCATLPPADRAYLDAYDTAEKAGRPFTPVTDTHASLTLPGAYRVQAALVRRRLATGDRIAGYKGGLMSQASLKARGVAEPLSAVLFRSGQVDSGTPVSLCGYRKGSFEMKLGFIFGRAPRHPARDAATLMQAVTRVVPVVDLPDIGYRNPDAYSAVDMIAANVSAARYVVGRTGPPGVLDLDALAVAMTRDGMPITKGFGRESFGSQRESLLAVVRAIARSGHRVKAGDLVITGKIGERGWLPPGAYLADYGPLGVVRFSAESCPG